MESHMESLAVTVVGTDRPGIVARVTAAIAELGGNLEDSSMSLLRGHFAMTLIATLPEGSSSPLQSLLAPLGSEGLSVSVVPLDDEATTSSGISAVLSVHGADRPGIVATATGLIAAFGGNITDLATRLGRDLYVLTADVTFPPETTSLADVSGALTDAMAPLGVQAMIQPVDDDLL